MYGCLRIRNPSDKYKKIADGLLHSVAQSPCTVLYFYNATCFHGTNINVISIMSIKKGGFAAQIFMKLTNVQQHSLQISYTKFHPNHTINVETTHKKSFMSYTKYCVNFVSFHGIQYQSELYQNQMKM